jgi:ATP-dependent Lon protease
VKEKTIGARRVGVSHLLFPEQNRQDFDELDDYIKEGITAHFASTFDQVLEVAVKMPVAR